MKMCRLNAGRDRHGFEADHDKAAETQIQNRMLQKPRPPLPIAVIRNGSSHSDFFENIPIIDLRNQSSNRNRRASAITNSPNLLITLRCI
jgi:hypothetical protein